jgi:hypothetical protein
MKAFLHVFFCCLVLVVSSPAYGEKGSHLLIGSHVGVYQKSVERWQHAISKHDIAGVTFIGRIPGNGFKDRHHRNGSRDTILFAPAHLSSEKQVEVIYFFHGLGGFGKRDFEIRLAPSIKKMINQGRNFILIVPELPWSSNTNTPRGRQDKAWQDKDGTTLVRFFIHVHQIFHNGFGMPVFDTNPKITIIAHSGGGGALKTIAKENVLEALKPDVIVMSESSYGNWADEIWKYYIKSHPDCKLVFLLLKGSEPYQRTIKLLKKIGNAHPNIRVKLYRRPQYSHVKVGDAALVDSAEFVYEK